MRFGSVVSFPVFFSGLFLVLSVLFVPALSAQTVTPVAAQTVTFGMVAVASTSTMTFTFNVTAAGTLGTPVTADTVKAVYDG